jgi:hypothetical protein
MKKIVFSLGLLLICSCVYAVDTDLGKFHLTDKQISQTESLKSDNIKGFAFWDDGTVIVVSERELSGEEQNDLRATLSGIPDEYSKEVLDQKAAYERFSLIEEKKTDLAVQALKDDGMLDSSGELTADGMAAASTAASIKDGKIQ